MAMKNAQLLCKASRVRAKATEEPSFVSKPARPSVCMSAG